MKWKWKRLAAFLLAAAMIFTMPGVPASAVEAGASAVHTGLCEHHPKHTEDCGYTEGTEGAACKHEHTEDCYTLVEKCIHKHDESCYPVLEGSVSENTATSSEVEEVQPTECTHKCSEESGCTTKKLSCPHEHDESCGYIPATVGLFPACPGMLRRSASAKSAVRKRRSIPTVRSALRKMRISLPAREQSRQRP